MQTDEHFLRTGDTLHHTVYLLPDQPVAHHHALKMCWVWFLRFSSTLLPFLNQHCTLRCHPSPHSKSGALIHHPLPYIWKPSHIPLFANYSNFSTPCRLLISSVGLNYIAFFCIRATQIIDLRYALLIWLLTCSKKMHKELICPQTFLYPLPSDSARGTSLCILLMCTHKNSAI